MHLRQLVSHWLGRLFPKKIFNAKNLGKRGEDAAAKFIRRLGYKILARGDRFGLGELDIVALDRETIVFVEVKTRESHIAGHPVEAVDLKKQQKLTLLAVSFLKHHRLLNRHARFDVIAITWPSGVKKPTIEHFQNAFEAVGQGGFYS
jgi:putative endonuclease